MVSECLFECPLVSCFPQVFLCWLWMAIYQGGMIMLLVVFLFARSFGQLRVHPTGLLLETCQPP